MSESPSRPRLDSVDLLRGIVMVIMMLDHTRDFVHQDVYRFDPTDLAQTTPLLFLTRWITHYCAPVFVFLAGTGSYLQKMRGKPLPELSRFLLTRGLWLVVLELAVVRPLVFFNFDYRFLGFLQVIWVIGVSMILLAALCHLPLSVVGLIGLVMIVGHNLLDGIQVAPWTGPASPAPNLRQVGWLVLHQQAVTPIYGFPSPIIFVAYPLIPWIGVMAAGYVFGKLYELEAGQRRRILLFLGGAATALFVIVRATNLYGDPAHWARQGSATFTILSFLNTTKYPPSLLFLLMTLGPAIASLAVFERIRPGTIGNFFITFGRVPLFFYLLQWFLAHTIAIVLSIITGKPWRYLFGSPLDLFANPPQNTGFNLWIVYGAWAVGIAIAYPLCRWFAGVKKRRRDWWLSYL